MYFKQFIFSFISASGFSIAFNSPRESVVYSGFIGSLGWLVYYIIHTYLSSSIMATFFAALTVGILSEVFARFFKKPATLYLTPGIITLVPGAGMYYTMLSLVEKDFLEAVNTGVETFFIAAAIAIGVIMSSVFSQSIKRVKDRG